MSLRRYLAGIAIGLCAAAGPAAAADYPTRAITIIVPFVGGTSTDIYMRALASIAEKKLGQPIVIDLKPGASGTLGPATMAATAKPDGYTLSQLPITLYRLAAMQKVSYDPVKDFTHIIMLTGYLTNTSVRADAPWKTFREFLDYAKANPGKVSYASSGTGSTLHITMEQIAMKEGIKFLHVPFRSEGEGIPALLGGHVQAIAATSGVLPQIDSGALRMLAVWTAERTKRAPDAPTLKELGFDIVANSPYGLGGPKGMDPKIVKLLHDTFHEAMADPVHKQTLEQLSQEESYMNTADYTAYAERTAVEQRELVKKLGLGTSK